LSVALNQEVGLKPRVVGGLLPQTEVRGYTGREEDQNAPTSRVKTLLNCKEGVQVSVGMKVSMEAY
jgi:hypothetical protein